MTNAEINQEVAIKAKEAKLTNAYETQFIEDIENLDKKELRKLTRNQYQFLNNIYKKYKDVV